MFLNHIVQFLFLWLLCFKGRVCFTELLVVLPMVIEIALASDVLSLVGSPPGLDCTSTFTSVCCTLPSSSVGVNNLTGCMFVLPMVFEIALASGVLSSVGSPPGLRCTSTSTSVCCTSPSSSIGVNNLTGCKVSSLVGVWEIFVWHWKGVCTFICSSTWWSPYGCEGGRYRCRACSMDTVCRCRHWTDFKWLNDIGRLWTCK